MRKECCHILISATNRKEANKIVDSLLKRRLISGSLILKGPAKYWWKGQIVEADYYNISAFSLFGYKSTIISEVKKVSVDTTPIIAFFRIEGDDSFSQWIKDSVK